jgi:hypothetical protein
MLKKLLLSIILFAPPLFSMAEQLKINDTAPKTYVVEKGDTLWDISTVFLKQPWFWPKLWRLNPEIKNPHLIYPGDVLKLIYDEHGEPMLVVAKKGKAAYKWSPKVRTKFKDDEAITVLPLQVIAPFLTYDSLFTEAQLEGAPYIIGSDEGYRMSSDGFKIYVNSDLDLAKTYAIYRKGEELLDPTTEDSVGFYMHLAGTAQVINTGNMVTKEPSTLIVNSIKREIHAGDIVLPVNEGQLLPSYFSMQAADSSLRGSIIKAISDNREFGQFEVVMVNLGSDKSAKIGDVLSIKRPSPQVLNTSKGPVYQVEASRFSKVLGPDSDYKMSEEGLGTMMIFRVYEKASLALILQTTKPARLKDIITSPQQ